MLETKWVGDIFGQLVTTILLRFMSSSDINKANKSTKSKLGHQNPEVVTSFKQPTSP